MYSAIIADQLMIYGGGYHLYNWWLSDIYYNIKQLVRPKKGVKIITNVFLFMKVVWMVCRRTVPRVWRIFKFWGKWLEFTSKIVGKPKSCVTVSLFTASLYKIRAGQSQKRISYLFECLSISVSEYLLICIFLYQNIS